MDINTNKEETEIISRKILYNLRKKKIHDEITAAIRLLSKQVEPIEVGDKFIHNIFKLMKDGISNRYPELTEKEIQQKIKDTLSLTRKIKAHKKRGRIIG